MATTCVELVISEHPPAITPALHRHYEDIGGRLERLLRTTVKTRRYTDPRPLDDAAAVILSGSFAPWAAHDPAALARLREAIIDYPGPVLGICAGMQLLVSFTGGVVARRRRPAIGFAAIEPVDDRDLLAGLAPGAAVYMHHADDVGALPDETVLLARSQQCEVEAIAFPARRWWGTQFHPERWDRRHPDGARVLQNFSALAGLW